MESQHGKWTLSDSDDDDGNNAVPPTPPKDIKKPLKSVRPDVKASPVSTPLKPKSEPRKENNVKPETARASVPALGTEARQAAHLHQSNPVNYDSSPSPALKRKREADEGGWNLSSSDDDNEGAPLSAPKNKPKPKASSSSPPRKRPERSRPPSPHGDDYYKEEPSDFFEASLNTMNDTYRLYLNKVTGIEKKYNTGALHIKGKPTNTGYHFCFVSIRIGLTYVYLFFLLLSFNRNTFPHVWHTKGIRPGNFFFPCRSQWGM